MNDRHLLYRGLAPVLAAVAALFGVMPSATAQPATIELSDVQLELNADGFEAAIAGDWARAARLFRASINEGEANVTLLNLGRALASMGECADAIEVYDRVESAPKVAEPPPEEVARLLEGFRAELPSTCPGTVVFTCEPVAMQVQIDDGTPQICPANPVTLAPGSHRILGFIGDARTVATIEVRGLEAQSVELEIPAEALEKEGVTVTELPPPPADPATTPLAIAGYASAGVGVALVVSGILVGALSVAPDQEAYAAAGAAGDAERYGALRESIESGQSAILGLWISGGVAIGVGAGLIAYTFIDAAMSSETDTDNASALAPWVAPMGDGTALGATWRATW